jgi:hypothetical protein
VDEYRPYHHGDITEDCPAACLLTVMSRKTWIPLSHGRSCLSEPPRMVGDVLDLYRDDLLGDIWNLGRRRVGEIEAALVLAGFDLGSLRHRAAGGGRSCR